MQCQRLDRNLHTPRNLKKCRYATRGFSENTFDGQLFREQLLIFGRNRHRKWAKSVMNEDPKTCAHETSRSSFNRRGSQNDEA